MLEEPKKERDYKELPSKQSLEHQSQPLNLPARHLRLDPGPKTRARRTVTFKGTCISCLMLILIAFVMVAISGIRGALKSISEPHAKMYQDPKSGIVSGPTVVKPLVGKKGDLGGLFDIHATIWIKENRNLVDVGGLLVVDGSPTVNPSPSAAVLFNDIVFTGISLEDKGMRSNVTLQIPTNVFKNVALNDTDLRASFVLIPNAPSLLERAVNFSTINVDSLGLAPVRSYPSTYQRTLLDEIIDSYGYSIKMLEFHPIQSRCSNIAQEDPDAPLAFPMDDMDATNTDLESMDTTNPKQPHRPKSTIGIPILQSHPYIITRTILRVIDETVLYNNKAYDERHRRLKGTKLRCVNHNTADVDCQRSFPTYGNLETKIRLQTLDSKGLSTTEWAYAPYISARDHAWGPMDLVPAPVNREECTPTQDGATLINATDQPSFNVTWHIIYSGRTAAKLAYGTRLQGIPLNMSATEEEKIAAQFNNAVLHGLVGHPYRDNLHPRRLTANVYIVKILFFITRLLRMYYYYSLATTTGLSTVGTAIHACMWLLQIVSLQIVQVVEKEIDYFDLIWIFLLALAFQCTPILMLKAALRAEIVWSSPRVFKILPLRFSPPTHKERASLRIESRIPRLWIIGAFCVMGATQYIVPFGELHIISPRNMITPSTPSDTDEYMRYVSSYIITPSYFLAKFLQLVHNYSSKTFAGQFKIEMWINATSLILVLANESALVVGYKEVSEGLSVASVLLVMLRGVEVVQTWLYPAISQAEDDDNVE